MKCINEVLVTADEKKKPSKEKLLPKDQNAQRHLAWKKFGQKNYCVNKDSWVTESLHHEGRTANGKVETKNLSIQTTLLPVDGTYTLYSSSDEDDSYESTSYFDMTNDTSSKKDSRNDIGNSKSMPGSICKESPHPTENIPSNSTLESSCTKAKRSKRISKSLTLNSKDPFLGNCSFDLWSDGKMNNFNNLKNSTRNPGSIDDIDSPGFPNLTFSAPRSATLAPRDSNRKEIKNNVTYEIRKSKIDEETKAEQNSKQNKTKTIINNDNDNSSLSESSNKKSQIAVPDEKDDDQLHAALKPDSDCQVNTPVETSEESWSTVKTDDIVAQDPDISEIRAMLLRNTEHNHIPLGNYDSTVYTIPLEEKVMQKSDATCNDSFSDFSDTKFLTRHGDNISNAGKFNTTKELPKQRSRPLVDYEITVYKTPGDTKIMNTSTPHPSKNFTQMDFTFGMDGFINPNATGSGNTSLATKAFEFHLDEELNYVNPNFTIPKEGQDKLKKNIFIDYEEHPPTTVDLENHHPSTTENHVNIENDLPSTSEEHTENAHNEVEVKAGESLAKSKNNMEINITEREDYVIDEKVTSEVSKNQDIEMNVMDMEDTENVEKGSDELSKNENMVINILEKKDIEQTKENMEIKEKEEICIVSQTNVDSGIDSKVAASNSSEDTSANNNVAENELQINEHLASETYENNIDFNIQMEIPDQKVNRRRSHLKTDILPDDKPSGSKSSPHRTNKRRSCIKKPSLSCIAEGAVLKSGVKKKRKRRRKLTMPKTRKSPPLKYNIAERDAGKRQVKAPFDYIKWTIDTSHMSVLGTKNANLTSKGQNKNTPNMKNQNTPITSFDKKSNSATKSRIEEIEEQASNCLECSENLKEVINSPHSSSAETPIDAILCKNCICNLEKRDRRSMLGKTLLQNMSKRLSLGVSVNFKRPSATNLVDTPKDTLPVEVKSSRKRKLTDAVSNPVDSADKPVFEKQQNKKPKSTISNNKSLINEASFTKPNQKIKLNTVVGNSNKNSKQKLTNSSKQKQTKKKIVSSDILPTTKKPLSATQPKKASANKTNKKTAEKPQKRSGNKNVEEKDHQKVQPPKKSQKTGNQKGKTTAAKQPVKIEEPKTNNRKTVAKKTQPTASKQSKRIQLNVIKDNEINSPIRKKQKAVKPEEKPNTRVGGRRTRSNHTVDKRLTSLSDELPPQRVSRKRTGANKQSVVKEISHEENANENAVETSSCSELVITVIDIGTETETPSNVKAGVRKAASPPKTNKAKTFEKKDEEMPRRMITRSAKKKKSDDFAKPKPPTKKFTGIIKPPLKDAADNSMASSTFNLTRLSSETTQSFFKRRKALFNEKENNLTSSPDCRKKHNMNSTAKLDASTATNYSSKSGLPAPDLSAISSNTRPLKYLPKDNISAAVNASLGVPKQYDKLLKKFGRP